MVIGHRWRKGNDQEEAESQKKRDRRHKEGTRRDGLTADNNRRKSDLACCEEPARSRKFLWAGGQSTGLPIQRNLGGRGRGRQAESRLIREGRSPRKFSSPYRRIDRCRSEYEGTIREKKGKENGDPRSRGNSGPEFIERLGAGELKEKGELEAYPEGGRKTRKTNTKTRGGKGVH